jgi:hypothetical protein
MATLCGFNARKINSEMVSDPRAIPAIKPIKTDAVFVANPQSCVDRWWQKSVLVLVISVRLQIGSHREFSLILSESLVVVGQSRRDIIGFQNVRTPFL